MNLEQKIGQLFLIGFQGDNIDASHPIAADITQRNLGGVILFDRSLATKQAHNNIQSADQVKLLTATLQGLARTPLLIGSGSGRRESPQTQAGTGFSGNGKRRRTWSKK